MNSNTDKKVKEWFWPLSIIAVVIGIIVGAVEALSKIWNLLDKSFYPTIVISTLALVLIVLKVPLEKSGMSEQHQRATRKVLCVVFVLVGIFAIGLKIHDKYFLDQGPSNAIEIKTGEKKLGFIKSAYGAEQSSLKLEHLGIDAQLSSYVERQEGLFGDGEVVRTFAPDLEVLQTRKLCKCTGPNGNQTMDLMVPLLRQRLETTINNPNMLQYIKNSDDLWRLMNKQRSRFRKIMFSPLEINRMLGKNDSRLDIIFEFMRTCHGVLNPVLRATLRNTGDQPVYVKYVEYNVIDIGDVRGGESGMEYPDKVITHTLCWVKGTQKFPLPEEIPIQPNKDYTLGLKLIPSIPVGVDPIGRAWFMNVAFIYNDGIRIESDNFQLIMNKQQ